MGLAGIFKTPVEGPVIVRTLNLDGDGQADLSVHGGTTKAVYGYPSEHYPFWQEALPGTALPWGGFGENLSTTGLWADEVQVGDEFRALGPFGSRPRSRDSRVTSSGSASGAPTS